MENKEDIEICRACNSPYEGEYCEDCFFECVDCEKTVSKKDESNISEVCEDCCEDLYSCCDDCNVYTYNDDTRYIEEYDVHVCESCCNNNYYYCENCRTRIRDGDLCNCDNSVNDHSYEPDYKFLSLDNDITDKYFGIELEIEIPDSIYKENISEYINEDIFYTKEDSSIDYGVEIVSMPMTLSYIKSIENTIKSMLLDLQSKGCKSYNTNTCGIHIHISRNAFTSSLHLYKFMNFIYSNPRFSLAISQRIEENLEKWSSLKADQKRIILKAKDRYFNSSISRYTAVNITDKETVEIRIFRGTLSFTSFMKNIEFCNSVFEYTKECSIPASSDIETFKKFIMGSDIECSNLIQFLTRKELL